MNADIFFSQFHENNLKKMLNLIYLNTSEDDDVTAIVEKAKEAITEKLRENGIDLGK